MPTIEKYRAMQTPREARLELAGEAFAQLLTEFVLPGAPHDVSLRIDAVLGIWEMAKIPKDIGKMPDPYLGGAAYFDKTTTEG